MFNLCDFQEDIYIATKIIKGCVPMASDIELDKFFHDWFSAKYNLIHLFNGNLTVECKAKNDGVEYGSEREESIERLLYKTYCDTFREKFFINPNDLDVKFNKNIIKSLKSVYKAPRPLFLAENKAESFFYISEPINNRTSSFRSYSYDRSLVIELFKLLSYLVTNDLIDFNTNTIAGVKVNKVIKDLCQGIPEVVANFDTFWSMFLQKFIDIDSDIFISIAPQHYLTMSESISWNSCHRISPRKSTSGRMGEYAAGCLAYALDPTTIIQFRNSSKFKNVNGVQFPSKAWRSVAHVDINRGSIITSREYPDTSHSVAKIARSGIMRLLAEHHGCRPTWRLTHCGDNAETDKHWQKGLDGYLFYSDAYDEDDEGWNYGRQCSLHDVGRDPYVVVGGQVHCLVCGKDLDRQDQFMCDKCAGSHGTRCSICSSFAFHSELIRYNDRAFCAACALKHIEVCFHCSNVINTHNDSFQYVSIPDSNNKVYFCYNCFDHIAECRSCNRMYENKYIHHHVFNNRPYCINCIDSRDELFLCLECNRLTTNDYSMNSICITCREAEQNAS